MMGDEQTGEWCRDIVISIRAAAGIGNASRRAEPAAAGGVCVGEDSRGDPLKVRRGNLPQYSILAPLAQLVEQLTLNQRVDGSSPSGGTQN